jgi:LysR family positive regulator for ilvC
MDIRTQRVFLSVCSTLNFTRSAEALHLSVSAVSRTIQRLEEELGRPLLERDQRSMRLTAAGRALRDYAQRSLADWQALRRDLSSESELTGEVSLFCSVTASWSILSPVLERFRDAYPGVDLMLHTGDQADGLARVGEGRDDLAVTLRPERLPSRLDFLALARSPLCLCVPTADCAVRRQVATEAARSGTVAWDSVPFIVPERGVTKVLIERWFAAQGIRRPRLYAQVAGHEAIVAMVALGLGVGFAPEIVMQAGGLASGVEALPLKEPLPELLIGLAALASRLDNPAVKALRDVAARTYPGPI